MSGATTIRRSCIPPAHSISDYEVPIMDSDRLSRQMQHLSPEQRAPSASSFYRNQPARPPSVASTTSNVSSFRRSRGASNLPLGSMSRMVHPSEYGYGSPSPPAQPGVSHTGLTYPTHAHNASQQLQHAYYPDQFLSYGNQQQQQEQLRPQLQQQHQQSHSHQKYYHNTQRSINSNVQIQQNIPQSNNSFYQNPNLNNDKNIQNLRLNNIPNPNFSTPYSTSTLPPDSLVNKMPSAPFNSSPDSMDSPSSSVSSFAFTKFTPTSSISSNSSIGNLSDTSPTPPENKQNPSSHFIKSNALQSQLYKNQHSNRLPGNNINNNHESNRSMSDSLDFEGTESNLKRDMESLAAELADSVKREIELESIIEKLGGNVPPSPSKSPLSSPGLNFTQAELDEKLSSFFDDSGNSINLPLTIKRKLEYFKKKLRAESREKSELHLQMRKQIEEQKTLREQSEQKISSLEKLIESLQDHTPLSRTKSVRAVSPEKQNPSSKSSTELSRAATIQYSANSSKVAGLESQVETLQTELETLKKLVQGHDMYYKDPAIREMLNFPLITENEDSNDTSIDSSQNSEVLSTTVKKSRMSLIADTLPNELTVHERPEVAFGQSVRMPSSFRIDTPSEVLLEHISHIEAQRDALRGAVNGLIKREKLSCRAHELEIEHLRALYNKEQLRAETCYNARRKGGVDSFRIVNVTRSLKEFQTVMNAALSECETMRKAIPNAPLFPDNNEISSAASLPVKSSDPQVEALYRLKSMLASSKSTLDIQERILEANTSPEDELDLDTQSLSLETAYRLLQQSYGLLLDRVAILEQHNDVSFGKAEVKIIGPDSSHSSSGLPVPPSISAGSDNHNRMSRQRASVMLKSSMPQLNWASHFSSDSARRSRRYSRISASRNSAKHASTLLPSFNQSSPSDNGNGSSPISPSSLETASLKSRVTELEEALRAADTEMREVVEKMQTAQIDALGLMNERDDALIRLRKFIEHPDKDNEHV